MGEPIRFDFGTGSDPDRNAPNSGPRHWNAYVEAVDDAKMALPIHADDGFVAFSASTSLGNIRALPVVVGNFIYALLGSSVVRVDASGTRLDVGGVTGTDRAIMARNDKASTPQIVIVLDGGLRFVVENDVVSSLSDVDLPAPNSCTFLNRKIVFGIPDGRFFWSATDEATDINSLDFAEAEGNPDGCVRVIAHLQELWIFGTESVEVWYDDGTSFVRRGSTVIPKGCIGKHTIAELDMDLFWVGNDNVVYAARGYGFERISTHYVEKLIRETSDKNTIIGWTYFRDGSAFYVLSGPDWTWRFNRTLSRKIGKPVWTDRESYNNGGRWLAEYAVQLNNEWIIGSNSNDALYRLSASAFDEAGTYLVWKIRSAPLHAFPKQICIDRLHLDFVTGIGLVSSDTHESDPQVGLRWSDDGGRTWSNQIFRSLGAVGQYGTRVTFDGLGITGRAGRILELEISSPVVRSLMYAAIEGDPAMV
jgi:hypothetical protein